VRQNVPAEKKISITRTNASNEDFDSSNALQDIDSVFKSSDWFLDNKGYELLKNNAQV